MLIEAGFDVAFECPATTPMILLLSIHPSRDADLLTPDRIVSDPSLLMRSYLDLFGNRLRASKFRRGSSRSPIASSFRTRASRTKHHPTCGRRRSSTFPTRRCCSCSRAAIATATSSPISPGRSSESCPAPCVAFGWNVRLGAIALHRGFGCAREGLRTSPRAGAGRALSSSSRPVALDAVQRRGLRRQAGSRIVGAGRIGCA